MPFDLKEYTILLIEDNAGDRLLIADYLEDNISRLHLVNADNYTEAVAVLSQSTPIFDVILLDLTLCDNNGD
jgi:CheY-like chemotaxis protein